VDHIFGEIKLSTFLVEWGYRLTEADARASIYNGVVKVNGEVVRDPDKLVCRVRLYEVICGTTHGEFKFKEESCKVKLN